MIEITKNKNHTVTFYYTFKLYNSIEFFIFLMKRSNLIK